MRCLLALCVGAAVCFGAIDNARAAETASGSVRLKDLGRFLGRRDNMLVGYGIVTGLSGSGDAPRNQATRQAMQNLLSQFDLVVPVEQIQSRNVAMVMITATLPATSNVGDKIDVNVTSTGDARSIAGGTLIMSPLRGPDKRVYALAQGPVTVGGFRFDGNGNLRQKNHPTVGVVSEGGTVEVPVRAELVADNGHLDYILKNADAVTSERIAARINESMGSGAATSLDPETVRIRAPQNPGRLNAFVASIEGLSVIPDVASRVIINERTGTIAAGGDTRISPITISHGDLRVSIDTEYTASQPNFIGIADDSVRSLIVGNSRLGVEEGDQHVAMSYKQTTVAELVASLAKARVNTRDVISILQAIKAAGALHADLVVQ
ncbi:MULTISPECIES: flagellar basal body P-ring protein FlgI [unclassified Lysobacter]|uniref:flagellar basal body P-ring protein FlgI n=1 Tax=unclassified Lysobacter TaxID=2635362 RepID=UPI001BEC7DE8|nr:MULTISPECIES: flagellar basal body P-ring protein FlgI [unclassified Lysobacter]MBT2745979.1 flagellar basal body P-ring protein FlgI [Lysobacter sp. ISL-42]MBT2752637.1 flagellar basal body P-ring protein FlgI [Lysobacter sp. ISL-50]MBT2777376.1 flagellar basal body P-ring protein FlgI [Lysobacter sp. ISL-54]MBT2783567.1 flagellar basal body P-ring protein FlgI [Lysobacter sp. ISL-52]